MAKRNRRRTSVSVAVILVLAVCGYLILSTLQEKHGFDFGLPSPDLPTLADLSGELSSGSGKASPSNPAPHLPEDGMTIHYLDVGQGDCTLITAPDKTVLIDAGERDQGDKIASYLRSIGVDTIDLLIATHPHADHIGGMAAVIANVEIGEILMPEIPDEIIPTTTTFTRLLEAIEEKGLTITLAAPGDTYHLGDGAQLTLLGPAEEYDNLNNISIVCRVDYGSTSFLFSGDAEQAAENALLSQGVPLSATVLKLGHHGSSTSTGRDFLDAVSPRLAIVSCGQDNSYGHPHREVMELLSERNIQILRTDIDGDIRLVSNGENVEVQLELQPAA